MIFYKIEKGKKISNLIWNSGNSQNLHYESESVIKQRQCIIANSMYFLLVCCVRYVKAGS